MQAISEELIRSQPRQSHILRIGGEKTILERQLSMHFESFTVIDTSDEASIPRATIETKFSSSQQTNHHDFIDVRDGVVDTAFSCDFFQWSLPNQFAAYLLETRRMLKVGGEFIFSMIVTEMPLIDDVKNLSFIYSLDSVIHAAIQSGFMLNEYRRIEMLPEGIGVSRFLIKLVKTTREVGSTAEVASYLTPKRAYTETVIASIEQVETWNQLEEACRAYHRRDIKSFEEIINSVHRSPAVLSADLMHVLAVLSSLAPSFKPAKSEITHHPLRFEKSNIVSSYKRYFGLSEGGVNLLAALRKTDQCALQRLFDVVSATKQRQRTVFVLGNGGSYDNARVIAKSFASLGIKARVPGDGTTYFEGDYRLAFRKSLESEGLLPGDLVLGLSGSGNSPNIIEAFDFALSVGAEVFALGGRDGGQMRTVVGNDRSLIAKSDCMEAIEDIHCALGVIVAQSIKNGVSPKDVQGSLCRCFESALSDRVIAQLANLAIALLKTVENSSSLYVVGSSIAANHFRADAQRGFTNGLPLRGICAPELYTTNSGMATANDDGPDFLLIDGIAKFKLSDRDFALLFDFPSEGGRLVIVKDWLIKQRTPFLVVGGEGSDFDFSEFFGQFEPEFVGACIAHATGVVLRDLLWERWQVRELGGIEKNLNLNGQRKLTQKEAEKLKNRLVQELIISENETITFCYGKVYAALDPSLFGLEPGYY